MQRWQMVERLLLFIHKSFVWSSMKCILMFIVLKTVYFPLGVLCKKTCAFLLQENLRIIRDYSSLSNLEKLQYLPHYWPCKAFKGINVNMSLQITFTVPLGFEKLWVMIYSLRLKKDILNHWKENLSRYKIACLLFMVQITFKQN